jgi:DNA-binding NarL/FixJ family response regulator
MAKKIEELRAELEKREAAVVETKEEMRELQQTLAVGAAGDLMKSFDSRAALDSVKQRIDRGEQVSDDTMIDLLDTLLD